MTPHPRIRNAAKWFGVAASAILLAAWIGSAFYHIAWYGRPGRLIQISEGCISSPTTASLVWTPNMLGWDFGAHPPSMRWWFNFTRLPGYTFTAIPLWPLALPITLLTAALWGHDMRAQRRTRRGHCPKCNYDRTGLPPNSNCPECGTPPANP